MINTRAQIITAFLLTLFLFVLYQLMQVFAPFFQAFFWTGILVFAFYPVHRFILNRTISWPYAAASISTLLVILIVILPSFFIIRSITEQTMDLYRVASTYVREGRLEEIIATLRSFAWVQSVESQVLNSELLKEQLSNAVLQFSRFATNFATDQLANVTKNIVVIGFNILLTVFLLFVFFLNGGNIYRFVYEQIPLEEKDRKAIFSKINNTFAGVIRGQFLTSAIQGVLAGVIFFFLGFPASAFFGVATFFASLIPISGASTVWVPMAVYLFLTGQWVKGVILVALGSGVISLSDNILKPIFISERTKIPVVLLFLGILGGLAAYGLIGIFLGPVLITVLFALLDILQERYRFRS